MLQSHIAPPHPYPCEWPHCSSRPTAVIHAQWTVVDFVSYFTCTAHFLNVWDVLRDRRVDGQSVVDMWSDVLESPEEIEG